MGARDRFCRLPLGAEIVLAFATGAGAFALAAVVLAGVGSGVVVVFLGVAYLVVVIAIARLAGIAYAVAVGVAGMVALDWFYLPPTHQLAFPDSADLVDLVLYLGVGVFLGEVAAQGARRAQVAERARGEIADEQAALRRVATLVAQGTPAPELFAAVAAEAGNLLDVHGIRIARYEDATDLVHVAEWCRPGHAVPAYKRAPLGGTSVSAEVFRTGCAARIDDYRDVSVRAAFARGVDLRSVLGAPIVVDGRLWGVMIAWSLSTRLSDDAEGRLAGFTELVATAIADTQARMDLHGFAEEQAALRRVATLVAGGPPQEAVFSAVTAEAGRLRGVDSAILSRHEGNDAQVSVGVWTAPGVATPFPVGTRVQLGGQNVVSLVMRTGRPARIDDYAQASGSVAEAARGYGLRSAVGVPVWVDGRLWGVMSATSTGEVSMPRDAEVRLAAFTELVATAIANAEARTSLTASRARVVAASDETRRRLERDLHDGIQQGLLSLILQAAAAGELGDDQAGQLRAELVELRTGLVAAMEELRETARGIHPSILTEAGLRPALGSLARRCAVPVVLDFRVDQRLPEPVEVAAYYVVSEALTNAVKHADAAQIDVAVTYREGALCVCVRDDGRGGADPTGGSGLIGLADRVDALDGRLSVHSPPGRGTTLEVSLPIIPPDRSAVPGAAVEPEASRLSS